LDRWGRVGKGELGDYSCDMHRAFTSFPQGRTGVPHSFASLICGLDNFHCPLTRSCCTMSCPSWKWRKRSSVKTLTERTHEDTSRRRTCSPGISGRFRPSGIGSWRRRGNSGRIAAQQIVENDLTPPPAWCSVRGRLGLWCQPASSPRCGYL